VLSGVVGCHLLVEGSLSGLQLLNLTSEAHRHQHVLHVGHVSQQKRPSSSSSGVGFDGLRTDRTSSDAFVFKFTCGPPAESLQTDDIAGNSAKMVLRMASVTYLHFPHLLHELALCVSDFQAYFALITHSLRSAAADLAMGLVTNRHAELLTAMSMYGSSWGLDVGHLSSKSYTSFCQQLEREWPAGEADAGLQLRDERVLDGCGAAAASSLKFLLDAVLESPIVMLPRSAGSSEVLSLHLGKIVISNRSDDAESDRPSALQSFSDSITVEIRNMSMCSSDLNALRRPERSPGCQLSDGIVMLHDTSIEMRLKQQRGYLVDVFAELYARITDDGPQCSMLDHLQVTGTVITPLRIVLTKHQYEQILNTLDNITLPNDMAAPQSPTAVQHNELGVPIVTEEVLPGVSALKCDELLSIQQPQLATASVSAGRPDPPLLVCGSFSLPSFIVQMRADLADGSVEKDIVALQLDGFEVNAVAQKWIKAFDFQLQVNLTAHTSCI